MKKIKLVLPLFLVLFMLMPSVMLVSGAGEYVKPISGDDAIPDVGALHDIIMRVSNTMFWLLVGLTVLLVMFAAYAFLTSGGDEEKTKKARNLIIYAIVAIVVGLLARILGGEVVRIMQGGGTPVPDPTP